MMKHQPTIYLIRHGEKNPKLPDGSDPIGLSAQGIVRANSLVTVFGSESPYNIGFILAQKPHKDGRQARPRETVAPLAQALGLQVNANIDRDDVKAVAKAAQEFTGPGNVLICWEHKRLAAIVHELGVKGYAESSGWKGTVAYPSERFDLIWTVEPPHHNIAAVTSEKIIGLDVKN